MKWEALLQLVADEPVFSSSLLLAGEVSPPQIHLQLSRWLRSGRLLRLGRGLYALAPPWRRVEPHPFVVANRLRPGSYVSTQSALAHHGLIPEHVPVVTSVGPGRPETLRTPLGGHRYNHIAPAMLFGYTRIEVSRGQHALLALPEKALLDLVHLTPGGDSPAYLDGLRLQNQQVIDLAVLNGMAQRSGRPKLVRAARHLEALCLESGEGMIP